MTRYEPAPKWDGRQWRATVDISDDRPGVRVKKQTIKGERSFENRDEALKESFKLLRQVQGRQKVATKISGKKAK